MCIIIGSSLPYFLFSIVNCWAQSIPQTGVYVDYSLRPERTNIGDTPPIHLAFVPPPSSTLIVQFFLHNLFHFISPICMTNL